MRISVLGAGAWGTAIAIALASRHSVRLWARNAEQIAAMQKSIPRENPRYLPACPFPETLALNSDLDTAIADAELLILAPPLAGLRPLLARLRQYRETHSGSLPPFLWLCKGLEAASSKLPHQVVADEFKEAPTALSFPCGTLTGPSFALEVARGLPTALTLAANNIHFASTLARTLHGGSLRIYANDDLVGAEVGGAVKNILAIAAGISDGLGLGQNARAALLTRGLVEMTRFGVALGARPDTFTGLTGLGDLILTCTGDLSRNRRVGLLLAEGQTLNTIQSTLGHVAEGVFTAREVARRAQNLGVDMPITTTVANLLDGHISPRETVQQLMARDARTE
ncbi:MAG: NAD(P)-dependent glycerol-3-phosphate dehydrogenase [Rugosibacter sp.]|nr:NAD(P)-dependent glycerol-3-phosphate dehydrogenase [Rugosibacter sp.]